MTLFEDRRDAGRRLAATLADRFGGSDLRVLGLARGGVPVAYEIALALNAPLDVLVVRKLGLPEQKEYAIGAIAAGDIMVLDHATIRALHISQEKLDSIIDAEKRELARRESTYRQGLPPLDIEGRVVIVVDDGLATGATMLAAVAAVRKHKPASVIAAVPVADAETCKKVGSQANDIVCLATPAYFQAVGNWYRVFDQTDDEEVRGLLARARKRQHVNV
jgi:predicted phosphoribosyltransferase